MTTQVYQADSYNKTESDIAAEFARSWFAEPRQVEKIKPDHTFTLVDGVSVYQIVHIPGGGYAVDVYRIYQLGLRPEIIDEMTLQVGVIKAARRGLARRKAETK